MTSASSTARQRELRKSALVGLIWWDYRRHREGFLLGLPSITLVALMIGLVENAGGPMFLWMGLAMGIGCGLGFGRGEWGEGMEEYSLGLPPTRRDRYLVRFALGLAFLGYLLLLGLAAGPLGWVRGLWELLPMELPDYRSEAAIWEAFQGAGFYFLAVGVTLFTFAECFATSIAVERPSGPWAFRLVPAAVGLGALVALDQALFPGQVGYLTGFVGTAYAAWRGWSGLRAFERKDAVLGTNMGSTQSEVSARLNRTMVILLGLTVLLAMGVWAFLAAS